MYTVPRQSWEQKKNNGSRKFLPSSLVLSIQPEESRILCRPGLGGVLGSRSLDQIADEVIEGILNVWSRRPGSSDDDGLQKSVPLVKVFDVFYLRKV